MSCNGCRVLRKGCSEGCALRPCLQWIDSPESQGYATLFLAKFFGRAGLMEFITAVPFSQRTAVFQSLLFEACGRTVNPVFGAVGLLWSGKWHVCQQAVETILNGGTLHNNASYSSSDAATDLTMTGTARHVENHNNNSNNMVKLNYSPNFMECSGQSSILCRSRPSKVDGGAYVNSQYPPYCPSPKCLTSNKNGAARCTANKPSSNIPAAYYNRSSTAFPSAPMRARAHPDCGNFPNRRLKLSVLHHEGPADVGSINLCFQHAAASHGAQMLSRSDHGRGVLAFNIDDHVHTVTTRNNAGNQGINATQTSLVGSAILKDRHQSSCCHTITSSTPAAADRSSSNVNVQQHADPHNCAINGTAGDHKLLRLELSLRSASHEVELDQAHQSYVSSRAATTVPYCAPLQSACTSSPGTYCDAESSIVTATCCANMGTAPSAHHELSAAPHADNSSHKLNICNPAHTSTNHSDPGRISQDRNVLNLLV